MAVSDFQNGGNTLCAVDDSNDHVLSVWDWQREDKLAEVKVCETQKYYAFGRKLHVQHVASASPVFLCLQCSNESVFGVDFHPTDCSIIVTCGKSHLYFWSLEKSVLVKKQGLFEVRHRHAASTSRSIP